jgi:S-DNA-T family DNA segregation ATPase FtsK/SpoIIIE
LKKHYFVFEQIFGKNIKFDGEIKTFVLSIRKPREEGEKDELPYSVEDIQNSITGLKLPVICGMNQAGEYKTLDLTKEPHILIAGETGSGKSTQLRSILTTWIMSKKPSELELYLGDCKKSEFHIFRKVDHVKCVFSNAKDIKKMLLHVKKELELRSDLTEMFEVGHVDDLPKEQKRPYIVVCIDEFVLLRKDETIMEILIDIVCVGRTLGVFAVLSMQRPNAKTLDTTIRSQCTVAMGFSMRDKIESTMVNTPGAEKIVDPGYFIMNADKLYDLQAPYLELDKAKELLNPYYVMKEPTKEAQPKQSEPLKESDVFLDVIDRQG